MKIYKHNNKSLHRVGSCKCCGECCKNLGLEIETTAAPNGKSKEIVTRELKQKEVELYTKQGYKDVEASRITWLKGNDFKFTLTLTCPHLKKNKCVIHSDKGYSKKPSFCQRFPEPGVVKPAGCGYRFKQINNS